MAIGNESNSSSVIPKPVISFIFLRNRPVGKLRADSGRSKDWAYKVRGDSSFSKSALASEWDVDVYKGDIERSDIEGTASLELLRVCNDAMTILRLPEGSVCRDLRCLSLILHVYAGR